jgi:hypothetical protein
MKFKLLIHKTIHLLFFILLTILTQIGGIIYLISLLLVSRKKTSYSLRRVFIFIVLYMFATFLMVPNIAPFFGRLKIEDNYSLKSHNLLTKICNRNYVTPKLYAVLTDVSLKLEKEIPNTKLIYLDANFPFFDGFPLLPHLSHHDGNKIDISFIYEDYNKEITNLKPSISGYGIFEEPLKGELNQTKICKENNFWQYDVTKYVSFGSSSKSLKFSEISTKKLIQLLLKNNKVSKIFIEPHLKTRLKLKDPKIRFHGCGAVRHDDHIHFQIL